MSATDVEETLVAQLKACGATHALTLPDIEIAGLIELMEERMTHLSLSREEVGAGISAGMYLGGVRSAMAIQSNGVGNMVHVLTSLNGLYGFPLPMLIAWRGGPDDLAAAKMPMGRALPGLFKAMGFVHVDVESEPGLSRAEDAMRLSYHSERPVGIFLRSSLMRSSARRFKEPAGNGSAPRSRRMQVEVVRDAPRVARFEMMKGLAPKLADSLVVCNLAYPSRELFSAGDSPSFFYMLSSWGMAGSIGLGLSLTGSERVVVLDGDGSLMHNPNALLQMAMFAKGNLSIVALDNGTYSSTGGQHTPGIERVDLELMARSMGIERTAKAYDAAGVLRELDGGTEFIHAIIKPGHADVPDLPIGPSEIKRRFMARVAKLRG